MILPVVETKYCCVVPFAYLPYKLEFEKDCLLDNVLYVDNTEHNRGVQRSWNMGIDKMLAEGCEWLIIMSATIRFGAQGGLDFASYLDYYKDLKCISAGGRGWHCIALKRDLVENIGKFDENFYPAYYEDTDYGLRMAKFYGEDYGKICDSIPANLMSKSFCHANQLAGVQNNDLEQHAYFARKWGLPPSGEGKPDTIAGYFDHPFNDPENPISYWPKVEGNPNL